MCSYGHKGTICGDCENNYSKFGDLCVSCLDTTINFIRLMFLIIIYVIFLGIYVM